VAGIHGNPVDVVATKPRWGEGCLLAIGRFRISCISGEIQIAVRIFPYYSVGIVIHADYPVVVFGQFYLPGFSFRKIENPRFALSIFWEEDNSHTFRLFMTRELAPVEGYLQ
jgi:hypothetical protein